MARQQTTILKGAPVRACRFRPFLQPPASSLQPRPRGIILMEVVLAMALLVLASGVIVGSMTACTRAAARVKLRAHAADLAVTLASEVQMGLLKPAQASPTAFSEAGFTDWTWEMRILTSDSFDAPLERVELTVRHTPTGLTHTLVQMVPVDPLRSPAAQPRGAADTGGDAT